MEAETESAELFRRLAEFQRLAAVDRRHLLDRIATAELALFNRSGRRTTAAGSRLGRSAVTEPPWQN